MNHMIIDAQSPIKYLLEEQIQKDPNRGPNICAELSKYFTA